MRKPLTGEPCAGEPLARFGGRGGRKSFSTPISRGAECAVGLIPPHHSTGIQAVTISGMNNERPLWAESGRSISRSEANRFQAAVARSRCRRRWYTASHRDAACRTAQK